MRILEVALAVLLMVLLALMAVWIRACEGPSVPRPQELSGQVPQCLKRCFDCRTRCGRHQGIDKPDCLATCYDMNHNCCEANDAIGQDFHCGCL